MNIEVSVSYNFRQNDARYLYTDTVRHSLPSADCRNEGRLQCFPRCETEEQTRTDDGCVQEKCLINQGRTNVKHEEQSLTRQNLPGIRHDSTTHHKD